MQKIKSVREADVSGKHVLLRVDFNVPIKDGKVLSDARIKRSLPTIHVLLERGAKEIILLSHLGRPEGKKVEEYSLKPVEEHLRTLVSDARITLRENLRFDPREENNDEDFAKELAALGDIYVNDAFSGAHRAHASIVGIPKFLPSYAGLLLEEEVNKLNEARTPPKGSIAVIGGAKFETKVPLLEKLLEAYEKIFLGGALANDLLKSRGMPVGSSLLSKEPVPKIIAQNDRLIAPLDVALLDDKTSMGRSTYTADVREGEKIFDVGPLTAEAWAKEVEAAPFVLWNGPLGMYEKGFVESTECIARALTEGKAKAVVGGGDTEAALSKFSFDTDKVFVSTGGGAMLEFLTQGSLPGIDALSK